MPLFAFFSPGVLPSFCTWNGTAPAHRAILNMRRSMPQAASPLDLRRRAAAADARPNTLPLLTRDTRDALASPSLLLPLRQPRPPSSSAPLLPAAIVSIRPTFNPRGKRSSSGDDGGE